MLYAPPLNEKVLGEQNQDFCSLNVTYTNNFFDEPNIQNTLRKITSPFDLKYYNLYLDINRKYPAYCNIFYPTTLDYVINNKSGNISFDEGPKKVGTIKFDELNKIVLLKFTYAPTNITDLINYRNITIPENKTLESISQNITVGEEVDYLLIARMTWLDALGNIFIFTLFWIAFIFLLNQVKEWIKK